MRPAEREPEAGGPMSDPKTDPPASGGPEPSWVRDPGEGDTTLEANWLFRLHRERFRSRR